MNEQEINHLLELADTGASVRGEAAGDLAERAIRRAGRRTAVKRTGLAVLGAHAVAAVVVVGMVLMPGTPIGSLDSSRPRIASATHGSDAVLTGDRELAELRARIAVQEAVIEALLAKEPRHEVQILQVSNPLDEVHAQIDLAAKRMVLAAARIEHEHGRNDYSNRLYRNVVSQFPDSGWAGIARKRIDPTERLPEPRSAL